MFWLWRTLLQVLAEPTRDMSAKKWQPWVALVLPALVCTGMAHAHPAPTLWGYTGLVNIPTADLLPDGQVVFGIGYVQRPYGLSRRASYDNATYYASLGFLPFLEVNLRVTEIRGYRPHNVGPGYGSEKDRSIGMRLRCYQRQAQYFTIAVGIHDPGIESAGFAELSNSLFSALYLVCSKHIARLGLHAGYAVDWLSRQTPHFSGLFAGLEYEAISWLSAMAEFDTHKVSAGVRCTIALGGKSPTRPGVGQPGIRPELGLGIASLGLKKLGGSLHIQLPL